MSILLGRPPVELFSLDGSADGRTRRGAAMRWTTRVVSGGAGVAMALALGVGFAQSASADSQYEVAWTGIGIYPRSAPSMDADHVGVALSDGASVSITCETTGDSVTSDITTSDIWEKLDDGTYVPNAFVDTGVDGFTPGVPSCDADTSQSSTGGSSSWVPYCGPSQYFSEISVEKWANGDFKIMAAPTSAARTALDPDAATVDEWHAIQDCVSGLYGSLADSIWDQLSCHQKWALAPGLKGGWATGDTYDLESWRGTFPESEGFSNHCGNHLNEAQDHTDEPISIGRPDDGVTDLTTPTNIG